MVEKPDLNAKAGRDSDIGTKEELLSILEQPLNPRFSAVGRAIVQKSPLIESNNHIDYLLSLNFNLHVMERSLRRLHNKFKISHEDLDNIFRYIEQAFSITKDRDTVKRLKNRLYLFAEDEYRRRLAADSKVVGEKASSQISRIGPPKFKDRGNPKESAKDFFDRVYARNPQLKSFTHADLSELDPSLWKGIHNWAKKPGNSIEDILPRGEKRAGRPRLELGFDLASLNPDDPKDAFILETLDKQDIARLRALEHRAKRPAKRGPPAKPEVR